MKASPSVRMRIVLREGRAMGPGKADLLAAIDRHGSIAAAGRSMGMSYQRAWSLVNELNHIFRKPVVAVSRGGSERGGAALTVTGREVLTAYRTIERVAAEHCRPELEKLQKLSAEEGPDISIGR
jgi:molybdate transport system regulatory protein